LARDPVGFPHCVTLRCPAGLLPEAGKLRLMKGFALAAREVAARAPQLTLEIVIDPDGPDTPRVEPGPRYTISPGWWERANSSLASFRRAALAVVEEHAEILVVGDPPVVGKSAVKLAPAPAQVLLFKNIFTLDVEGGEALQINPGVHYLISPLLADGVEVVLLDGKLPLQDVCERPPALDTKLTPRDFLTDPQELERALASHPELNLVCLTVLERSFTQIRALCEFIHERSRAFIAVGGVFATVTPEHCFAHLSAADFVVRGDGEEVLRSLARIVAGRTRDQGLDDDGLERLSRLQGIVARTGDRCVAVALDRVNRVDDLDDSVLDFSFFERANVESGLSISTSRGCVYSCRFCSVMDKTHWRGKTVDAVMRDLEAYERRLVELYGSVEAVPETARRLQIWDDDLFIEPERAKALLPRLVAGGFTATFLQGTVASFYRREGKKISRELNESLLDAIPPSLFTAYGGLKIGTESFNDPELKRLGKPYDYDQVHRLVLALSQRGIKQEHYRILCGRQTTLNELLDNLEKTVELRWTVGSRFSVLEPSWLMHLFPTALFRASQVQGTEQTLPTYGALRELGYAELDYPFILPDPPERREVYEVVRRFPSGMHYGAAGRPDWIFDEVFTAEDRHYLRVFEVVRRALEQRRDRLTAKGDPEDRGEQFRIEKALAERLGGRLWIPLGVVSRLAPALEQSVVAVAPEILLTNYVQSLLGEAHAHGELDSPAVVRAALDGVVLEVVHRGVGCSFLVQRYSPGANCAFHTLNLAVIVQSSVVSEGERERLRGVIEHMRDLMQRLDEATLD
jgi:B12 binding domain